MKPKLLILTNNSGGLYDFRHELIIRLSERFEVAASTPFDDKTDDLKRIGCRLIETDIDRRGINPVKDLGLLRKYKKIIKQENPELVITYTIKPNVYGGYVCRRKKIPYAVNITGLGTTFQNEGLLKKLVCFMYKTALKKAKVVFFENKDNQRVFISEKIVPEAKTCVLNGAGVNIERYPYTDYPKDSSKTRFLFMGRVMKEKGIDELFEVMSRLNAESIRCELYVLGSFEEDYGEIIKKYESEGWLKYMGHQDDVRPYIADSHCFVLPSWHEGMANTNLECASMGRPVITSRIHGCMEAVEDGVSGYLCEKQNPEDLYKKMKSFISLPYEERRQMGLAGRKRMEEVFDKRKVVEMTINNLF